MAARLGGKQHGVIQRGRELAGVHAGRQVDDRVVVVVQPVDNGGFGHEASFEREVVRVHCSARRDALGHVAHSDEMTWHLGRCRRTDVPARHERDASGHTGLAVQRLTRIEHGNRHSGSDRGI